MSIEGSGPGPNDRPNFPPSEEIDEQKIIAFHRQGARLFAEARDRFTVIGNQILQGLDTAPLNHARYRADGKVVTVVSLDDELIYSGPGEPEALLIHINTPLPSSPRRPNTYLSEFFEAGSSPPELRRYVSVVEYDLEGKLNKELLKQYIRGAIFDPEGGLRTYDLEEQDRLTEKAAQQYTYDRLRELQEELPEETAAFMPPLKPEHLEAQTAFLARITPADEIGSRIKPYRRT